MILDALLVTSLTFPLTPRNSATDYSLRVTWEPRTRQPRLSSGPLCWPSRLEGKIVLLWDFIIEASKLLFLIINFSSFYFSYHLSIGIDFAVSALLGVFTAVTTLVPKFQSRGGSLRENLALQNVQV